MIAPTQTWRHPGGKLRELGPESLSDVELVAILISSGIKGKSAEKIAHVISLPDSAPSKEWQISPYTSFWGSEDSGT